MTTIIIITSLIISTYFYLKNDKELIIDLCDSFLKTKKRNKLSEIILFSILFPITITFLIKNKKMKETKKIVSIAIFYLVAIYLVKVSIDTHNTSVTIKSEYKVALHKRGITFNKMKQELKDNLNIALINDSSFQQKLEIVMSNKKDSKNLVWKWLQEVNPNSNYNEVSQLYVNLTNSVTALRNELEVRESEVLKSTMEWEKLHNYFPSNIFLFYQEKELKYTPILTKSSKLTNETGLEE